MRIAIALIAVGIAGATAYLGRRDLSRPPVVFGVLWFAFVALAQLQLTTAESDWSAGFAAATIGGGLVFMIGALAAGGTRPARGTVSLEPAQYMPRRLLAIALVLMVGGTAGWVYKAHVLGGVPLLSDSVDIVRARAFAVGLPAWSSALTGGFYLAFWVLVAAAHITWKSARPMQRAALLALAAVSLFGVALDGSRNLVLLAVIVPLVAGYVLLPRATRGLTVLRATAAVAIVALIVGGLFVARFAHGQAGNTGNQFVQHQLDSHSPLLRPFIPLYVNAVLPLDGSQSLRDAIPANAPWGRGAYSLMSLPDAAFPDGKPDYPGIVGRQLLTRGAGFWVVATYQGRSYGDFGEAGVIVSSLLLGLMFGGAYRFAIGRSGLFALALIGYIAHYTAYLTYDNLLSFTLIAFYDLVVVYVADRLARRATLEGAPAISAAAA
ncbi:MAG: hypothetical protein QOF65_833 [Thermoleophilaceae bacterium]|jgi:hypothetical protein|nr:hypothetical protein [Thermoleophilaceae bacterium]